MATDSSNILSKHYIIIVCGIFSLTLYYIIDLPITISPQVIRTGLSQSLSSKIYLLLYNLLFAFSFLGNSISMLFIGHVIDYFDTDISYAAKKTNSIIWFVVFIGHLLFAFSLVHGFDDLMSDVTKIAYFICLLIGRFLLGIGCGASSTLQKCFLLSDYRTESLPSIILILASLSRFGTVSNFLTTYPLFYLINGDDSEYENESLFYTFIPAIILVIISLIIASTMCLCSTPSNNNNTGTLTVKLDISIFTGDGPPLHNFWLLVAVLCLFYSVIFPLVTNSSLFLIDNFLTDNNSQLYAAFISSIIFGVSFLFSPFVNSTIERLLLFLHNNPSTDTTYERFFLFLNKVKVIIINNFILSFIFLWNYFTRPVKSLYNIIPIYVLFTIIGLIVCINSSCFWSLLPTFFSNYNPAAHLDLESPDMKESKRIMALATPHAITVSVVLQMFTCCISSILIGVIYYSSEWEGVFFYFSIISILILILSIILYFSLYSQYFGGNKEDKLSLNTEEINSSRPLLSQQYNVMK